MKAKLCYQGNKQRFFFSHPLFRSGQHQLDTHQCQEDDGAAHLECHHMGHAGPGDMWMWHLGMCFDGGFGSAGEIGVLSDLEWGFFHPK